MGRSDGPFYTRLAGKGPDDGHLRFELNLGEVRGPVDGHFLFSRPQRREGGRS